MKQTAFGIRRKIRLLGFFAVPSFMDVPKGLKGILGVFGAILAFLGSPQPAHGGVDEMFRDDFESRIVTNIIGLSEGFEGTRVVTARICDREKLGIASVTLSYRPVATTQAMQFEPNSDPPITQGAVSWVDVSMQPIAVASGLCQDYESSVEIPLEYGLALNDSGRIEWEFTIEFQSGDSEVYPQIEPGRTLFWATEETAQQVIELALGTDDNAFVACYDCEYNTLQYDAIGFFFGNGQNFAIEYNGESRSSDEIEQMEDNYEDASSKTFFLLELGSVSELTDRLATISNKNQKQALSILSRNRR
ncbi:hypothetical protein [Wenzhouxiangella marina]|uniref:Uncharacterized protein n=1 Tax=Wenzhouxiangella marina TaxID=1579979 RepID=A0A0K0XZE2_9GAMM|nr:hypothetical protein [Wenzhouxiangella marina]AKS43058.1 hypothetical protein WM2015_2700 [Wenzhouxiangella marina]MBB6087257.1 hypothetical protein [Wenzhouxiangella marina]